MLGDVRSKVAFLSATLFLLFIAVTFILTRIPHNLNQNGNEGEIYEYSENPSFRKERYRRQIVFKLNEQILQTLKIKNVQIILQ